MGYPIESCGGAGDIIGVVVPLGGPAIEYGEAPAAFLAAYKLASSCALPMFFLYRMRLLPNQLETWETLKNIKCYILMLQLFTHNFGIINALLFHTFSPTLLLLPQMDMGCSSDYRNTH